MIAVDAKNTIAADARNTIAADAAWRTEWA